MPAPRLVDLQRKMYASLNESDSTICVSDKWEPDDGMVTLLIAEDEENEAATISEHISAQIESGIEPNKLYVPSLKIMLRRLLQNLEIIKFLLVLKMIIKI